MSAEPANMDQAALRLNCDLRGRRRSVTPGVTRRKMRFSAPLTPLMSTLKKSFLSALLAHSTILISQAETKKSSPPGCAPFPVQVPSKNRLQEAWGSVAHTAPLVRSSQLSAANPFSTRTMVMHSSTGHTSEHRLQPTHSVSSTRGIRARGVGYGPCSDSLIRRSLRVTGVLANTAGSWSLDPQESGAVQHAHPQGLRRDRDECTGGRHPSTRCGTGRSQCISAHRCGQQSCSSG